MKLVWCPETASKAYIDAVKTLADRNLEEVNIAELVSALAGGWRAQLVVEAWARDAGAATAIGLQSAIKHAQGRHVCLVPDQQSAAEYADAMRRSGAQAEAESVVVGEPEEVMRELEGADLVVVDCRRRDAGRVLRAALPGPMGMVVVCKAQGGATAAATALGAGTRVVMSAHLAIGSGVEVLHVCVGKGLSLGGGGGRWIRLVDRCTKEEFVFRLRR